MKNPNSTVEAAISLLVEALDEDLNWTQARIANLANEKGQEIAQAALAGDTEQAQEILLSLPYEKSLYDAHIELIRNAKAEAYLSPTTGVRTTPKCALTPP